VFPGFKPQPGSRAAGQGEFSSAAAAALLSAAERAA